MNTSIKSALSGEQYLDIPDLDTREPQPFSLRIGGDASALELRRPLPAGRTLEQLKNHYLVEKAIAQKLMRSTRDERKKIYATMYDELFARVPDHPRLSRRADSGATSTENGVKLDLVGRFLDKSKVFLEYAPGDCRFAIDVATRVKHAYGLDISDQRRPGEQTPDNFELVIYDGYQLDAIPDGSVDVIFSDQLIEHFHPDDTRLHFELAHRLLKDGGIYVFRTPHILKGPHDVSMYFSDVPECFHLKEWTYREIRKLLLEIGYSAFRSWQYRYRTGTAYRLPYAYFAVVEAVLSPFPRRRIRRLAQFLLPQLYGVAVK